MVQIYFQREDKTILPGEYFISKLNSLFEGDVIKQMIIFAFHRITEDAIDFKLTVIQISYGFIWAYILFAKFVF